ncbi:YciI family protein [Pseudovibrio sp. JE062]|uniref:YciI family protein n=1 Tax=Pseudovibrio sp. JE062 TaxID=439495 RepID=UPI000186BBBC|nr:YciI family protein [Pseudovibrio sp. JE062]EEA93721.1 YCII-related domain superfamily protein [Pseudovibrio sp. JE062]
MPLIPNSQNVFVVDLHYTANIDQIEPLLEGHVAFLEEQYKAGRFIASGPKVPRSGGVIIATAESRELLEELLTKDPFYQQSVATYTVTEFRPSMKAQKLEEA